MLTVILISVLVGFILYSLFLKGKVKSPPEPFSWPIFGHLLFMGKNPVLKSTEWGKKYGPIMQIRFGSMMTEVIVDDVDIAKEMYNDLVFSGTPDMHFMREFNNGKNGILFNEGPMWEEQRRFTLWHLRDFGFGKKAVMEEKIVEEIKELLNGLKKLENKPVELKKKFEVAGLNVLWVIITGQRYSHDDPQVTLLMDNFNAAIEKMVKRFVVMFFPWVGRTFPEWTGWGGFLKSIKDLRDFFKVLVQEHKKDLQENNPRDFIDVYLDEINRTTNPKSSFYKEKGEESLVSVIFDLFQAGFGTTSMTLNWSILFLTTFPEVQTKLQEEIDRVIGKNRLPSLDDKANMPFTEALMMEIFRKSALLGLIQSHSALKDTTFHGYEIKKGTIMAVNQYSINSNPKIWGDPENFRPERFIDEQGNCVKRHDALNPFSTGKRVCIGESLARDQFFLFLVSIFQRFSIKLDPDSPKPSLEGTFKGVLHPPEYKVVLKDRF